MAAEITELLDGDKLFLTQIRYLEEQLENCQNKCEELENQVQDLLYEQRVLRKDKADVTRYLKRSLDAKDKKVEMLMEQVESQQEAAERQKESMEQLEATVAQLEAHIQELNGEISTQVGKLEAQAGQLVALEEKLVKQKQDQEATVRRLKEEAERDKTNMIAETMRNMEVVFEDKMGKVLQQEREQNSEKMHQLQNMLGENMTLWQEKDVMQKRELELYCEVSRLQEELVKKPRRKLIRRKPCRSVFMFAKLNAIPFDFKLVDLAKGEQYGEEFGKITPVRKVPVMKDGDFVLTESVAILQYLAEKHASRLPDHWYPADLRQRARVNEYLSWQQMNLRAHGSKVFLLKNMYPLVMGQPVPEDKMSSVVEELSQTVDVLDKYFLGEKLFLCGASISLADLVAVAEIMQPVSSGVDVFSGRPKLSAWCERVKKEVGVALFDEANAAIMTSGGVAQSLRETGVPQIFKDKFKKTFL